MNILMPEPGFSMEKLILEPGFSMEKLILQARQEGPKMGILLAACWGKFPKPLGAKPYGFCT